MIRALVVGATLAVVTLAPAGAEAATRYASPTGTGPEPCAEANPCSLPTATSGGLARGDTVILLGARNDVYSLGRTGITINRQNVTLSARERGVQILSTSTTATITATIGSVTVSGVRVFNGCGSIFDTAPAGCTAGTPRYALSAAGADIQGVIASSFAGRGCMFSSDMTVANTVCIGRSDAMELISPGDVNLTNVTVRASATYPALGITTTPLPGGACRTGRVTMVNSIVSSASNFAAPLWANTDGRGNTLPGTCPMTLTLRTSSVPTKFIGMNVTLNETGAVLDPPVYSDASGNSVIPAASSPTLNRGSTTPADLNLAGPLDVNGAERVQGGRIDIGAYEYAEGNPPPEPVPPALNPGQGGNAGGGQGGNAGGGQGGNAGGGQTAAATMSVLRPRAKPTRRAVVINGNVRTTGAGTVTRTVVRLQGKRRIQICRVTVRLTGAGTKAARCATRPAVRNLLRRRGLQLVVTTRFVPEGTRTAVVDRQTLRLRKR